MTPALRFLSTAITTASPDEASGSLFIAGVFLNGGKPRLTPSALNLMKHAEALSHA